jgi:outer membrane protein insertion porin family
LRRDEVTDVDSDASKFIQQESGNDFISLIGHNLSYDQRNSRVSPTAGYLLRLGNDFAGVGGDISYLKTTLFGIYYYSVAPGWVLNVRGDVGFIFGIGDDDVRINDRFFLGGNNLRGFASGGAGPRDTSTDDALGGKQLISGAVELIFPLGLPKQFGVNGAIFSDFGTLTGLDFDDLVIADTGSIRLAAGIGVTWDSPFGPVRIDFSVPLIKEDFDETENIRFNFGTRF